jgi:arylsulfatase A-like enzyme
MTAGQANQGRRRRGLVALVALGIVAALLLVVAGRPEPSAERAPAETAGRPDVVVVLTDDQRLDSLAHMSHVQRLLAGKGAWFPNAFVPTPLCCPSRASLLTGRYAHDTGVYSNKRPYGGWWVFQKNGLENRTIAVALHRAGYRTGFFGKYFNAYARWAPDGHRPPGWDEFLAFTTLRRSGGYYGYRLSDGSVRGQSPGDYSTDVLAAAATRFVRSAAPRRPLLLWFAPFAPHAPYKPAPRHAGSWAGRLPGSSSSAGRPATDGVPGWVRGRPAVRPEVVERIRAQQQEALAAVDEAVAGIVDALRDTGRLRNTLIVFASDNGLLLGEHSLLGKAAPYTPAIAVPLVLRWDGHLRSGHVDRRLALNLDVPATIAAAAGVRFRSDGLSLLGDAQRDGFLVEGAAGRRRGGRPAYCGWRTGSWTYTRWATGEEELFAQLVDPGQLENLAGDPAHAEVLRRLRAEARAACVPQPPGFAW